MEITFCRWPQQQEVEDVKVEGVGVGVEEMPTIGEVDRSVSVVETPSTAADAGILALGVDVATTTTLSALPSPSSPTTVAR